MMMLMASPMPTLALTFAYLLSSGEMMMIMTMIIMMMMMKLVMVRMMKLVMVRMMIMTRMIMMIIMRLIASPMPTLALTFTYLLVR